MPGLLRLCTAGSVDDGKSTLIGRLLYDSRGVYEDQVLAVERSSRNRTAGAIDFSLFTDGLRAEREQGITIDVAYRYFATPRRKFIIADTPGHVQYTRNMVTGASTADLAVILVDATKGVLTQSRRHAFITSLLGIPHIIVAVNKMDLVDYSEEVYESIARDFRAFAAKLTVKDVSFVPLSALEGDNVVAPSARMPWYQGGPLLHRLETVSAAGRTNPIDFRFPVQSVIRSDQTFRGYAGTLVSGSIAAGEEIVVLPSGLTTAVQSIETFDGPRDEAAAWDAVVLTIRDALDISRGDMIVRKKNLPTVANRFDAYLCWMSADALETGRQYVLFHTTREVQAFVDRVDYRVDVDTLHRQRVPALGLNEIGRVEITTGQPLFFDSYRVNAATGSFILIDAHTNVTVAAGMIRGEVKEPASLRSVVSPDVVRAPRNIAREEREQRNLHRAGVIWLTGMSGAGKSTIARGVERHLFDRGCATMLLDGDEMRHGLCGDLGFSPADRTENIRRAGEVAKLFFDQGSLVICAFVSPYRADRDRVRALFPGGRFVEVFVKADLETCQRRDPKRLYARAKKGEVAQFTGVSAPYEPPLEPDLVIDTDALDVDASVDALFEHLQALGLLRAPESGKA
jgi:bifunctional enzyme CysN/CysC